MASLIDKLRAAQPIRQPDRPSAQDCLTRVQRYPCQGFPAGSIAGETLRLMTGIAWPEALGPEELLFLDTETTGLQGGAGTLAFLVGLGGFEDGQFVVRQYLMRDYDEEPFVLAPVIERLGQTRVLVTFNGASFDVPLLESRLTMNRLRLASQLPPHLDLLHIARRVYKLRLGRCSLQALESEVFGLSRTEDLPGAEVPERFFRFLKTRDLALLEDILRHNAQDVLSLARLLYALSRLHEQPMTASDQRDLFSLGRVYERRGEPARAGVCYRACSEQGVRDLAQLRLADLLRRGGDHQGAASAYEALRLDGRGGPRVYIALAKLYEHRFREPGRALAIARQGMVYCLERYGKAAEQDRAYQDLSHRAGRLLRKTKGR